MISDRKTQGLARPWEVNSLADCEYAIRLGYGLHSLNKMCTDMYLSFIEKRTLMLPHLFASTLLAISLASATHGVTNISIDFGIFFRGEVVSVTDLY